MEHKDILGLPNDAKIILEVLKFKAYEYLKDELINKMQEHMQKIASDAVTQWAEVRLTAIHDAKSYNTVNINIAFIEHIVKTQFRDNPIQVHIKE